MSYRNPFNFPIKRKTQFVSDVSMKRKRRNVGYFCTGCGKHTRTFETMRGDVSHYLCKECRSYGYGLKYSDFWDMVKEAYQELMRNRDMSYVQIAEVKPVVVRKLGISSDRFDELFNGPNRPDFRMDLATAPMFQGFKYMRIW